MENDIMTIDLATQTTDTMLDALADGLGSGAMLRIFTGPQPATCADPDSGYELVVDQIADGFWAPANGGAKVLSETWGYTGLANDDAGHFRIYANDYTCRIQGTVSAVNEGGDLQLLSATIEEGASVTVVSLTLTSANL